MSYEKTFNLNGSMIAWPAGVGVKALTVAELEEGEVEARLAEIGCGLECSETNDTLCSKSPIRNRDLTFCFGNSEGGFGAYLHNSLNTPIIINRISVDSGGSSFVELHTVSGIASGGSISKVIDPTEYGYLHNIKALSGNVKDVVSRGLLDIKFVAPGTTTVLNLHGLMLDPGQAIALKSDRGFRCGAIEGTVVNN